MRRVVLCLITSVVMVLGLAAPASGAEVKVRSKWRDCESTRSGLAYRTTFITPAQHYGPGRYIIKSQIRWDKYTVAGWRKLDVNTTQTPWTHIRNVEFNFSHGHGDRTVWGNVFHRRWRAHVILKLIKNRPGPRDKRVETVERFFEKARFPESGACGTSAGEPSLA